MFLVAAMWESWLATVMSLLAVLLATVYIYATYKYTYWKRRGIPFVPPSFPFGNLGEVLTLKKSVGQGYQGLYNELEGHPYGGTFQIFRQTLVLRDPEVISDFLIKDFAHFHDRGIAMDEKNDPFSDRLFFLSGPRWKRLRVILSPTFSSGKMKMMFETISDCAAMLKDCIRKETRNGVVDMKEISARFTTDVIASCAFGIQCNCLLNPEAEFRQKGREVLDMTFVKSIAIAITFVAPGLTKWLKLRGSGTTQALEDFFTKTVKETVSFREENSVTRKDFMQMLIELQKNGFVDMGDGKVHSEKHDMTEIQLVAQAFGFFVAGFETSSSTISYCLFEMAANQDVQTRVREEFSRVIEEHGGEVSYEAISDMPYLDRVVSETLRKYPPITILNRECTVPYQLPGTDVVLETGTTVIVPLYAIQHDPKHFPDPERFDPERFTSEGKKTRHTCAYLAFGAGPRKCLGMRFGQLETKLAVISLLTDFSFKLAPQTPPVLVYDPKTFFLSPISGIHLSVTEIAKTK